LTNHEARLNQKQAKTKRKKTKKKKNLSKNFSTQQRNRFSSLNPGKFMKCINKTNNFRRIKENAESLQCRMYNA
jgi:hypothetical protein